MHDPLARLFHFINACEFTTIGWQAAIFPEHFQSFTVALKNYISLQTVSATYLLNHKLNKRKHSGKDDSAGIVSGLRAECAMNEIMSFRQ